MTTLLAWIPAFFAIYVAFFRSPEKAFMNVYLPILILLPQVYYAKTLGFPQFNFCESAIIPIFIIFLFTRLNYWHFSFTDVIIVLFIGVSFYSEWVNSDFSFAKNKLATTLADVLAPYVLTKVFIHPRGLSIPFIKRFVFLMFINSLITLYELHAIAIPQVKILQRFFPGQGQDWIPLQRYGLLRVRGPFSQTIFYGMGLAISIILNWWMIKNKLWTVTFKNMPHLFFRKGTIILFFLALALIFTFSRGPWLSCIIGIIMMGIAFANNPFKSSLVRLAIVFAISFFYFQSVTTYTDIDPTLAKSDTEANIAYRSQLVEQYVQYIWQKPYFGWGSQNLPLIKGIRSIDNQYLYLALKNGLVQVAIFVFLIAWMMVRLYLRGIKTHLKSKLDSTLSFTLMTIFFMYAVLLVTVYLGLQIEIIFYLLIGWSEGLLMSKPDDSLFETKQYQYQKTATIFRPRRTLAITRT